MKLEDLGYYDQLKEFQDKANQDGFELGRVVAEHKERFIVSTTKGEYEAEITGHLRFTAKSREDFPSVGDWVALTTYDADFGITIKHFHDFRSLNGKLSDSLARFRSSPQILITLL